MKRFISLFLVFLLSFSLVACGEPAKAMSDEEFEAYLDSITREYKVVSVYQYMDVETNIYGGIIDQDIKYGFTYIGDDGQLHEFDDFEHTEYGLWKICIGDENKYVVRDVGLDTYRWLILTSDTFENMKIIQ